MKKSQIQQSKNVAAIKIESQGKIRDTLNSDQEASPTKDMFDSRIDSKLDSVVLSDQMS